MEEFKNTLNKVINEYFEELKNRKITIKDLEILNQVAKITKKIKKDN